MAQMTGLFGLTIGYGDSLKQALKKAGITKYDLQHNRDQYGIYTVKDGGIVRIRANGAIY